MGGKKGISNNYFAIMMWSLPQNGKLQTSSANLRLPHVLDMVMGLRWPYTLNEGWLNLHILAGLVNHLISIGQLRLVPLLLLFSGCNP